MNSTWTAAALTDYVLERINQTTVDTVPFPHIIVPGLLPEEVYSAILQALPPREAFDRVEYPGTGFGRRKNGHGFGYAYRQLAQAGGLLSALHAVFASEAFSRALLAKFSQPIADGSTPIPKAKHRFFANGAKDYTPVFDLQIDLPGYAIPPHPDVESKILTFQLYLTNDVTLANFGTQLCSPKDERAVRGRSALALSVGNALQRVVPHDSGLYHWLEQSRIGQECGIGRYKNWLPWSWFTVTKIASALPNHFLAFAPNERSFHAVNLDIPRDNPVQERQVIRGFVRAGSNTSNWMSPLLDKQGEKMM